MMIENTPATPQHRLRAVLNGIIAVLLVIIGYEAYRIHADAASTPVPPSAHVRDSIRVNGGMQIDVLNGCGAAGVGQRATDYCRSIGYDVVEMKNYKNFNQDESLVIDRCGKLDAARRLASHIGIDPSHVVQELSRDYFVAASVVIGKDYARLHPWNQQTKQ